MSENVPPATPGAATTAGGATPGKTAGVETRGLPYYESLRRSLRDTLAKKRALDRNLLSLEEQIYRAETTYLEETSAAGNIVKGFDNYIKASATSTVTGTGAATAGTISGSAAGGARERGGGAGGRRAGAISDADRVFSKSSVSWTTRNAGGDDTPGGGASAVSTPGVGTPGGSFDDKKPEDGRRKKKKGSNLKDATESEAEVNGRANKRQKITFGPRKGGDD